MEQPTDGQLLAALDRVRYAASATANAGLDHLSPAQRKRLLRTADETVFFLRALVPVRRAQQPEEGQPLTA